MSSIDKYKEDAKRRIADREREKKVAPGAISIPSFAEGTAYNPATDGPVTMGQLADAQRRVAAPAAAAVKDERGLSQSTVQGLQALKDLTMQQHAQQNPQQPQPEAGTFQPPLEQAKEAAPQQSKDELLKVLQGMDRYDLAEIARKIEQDVLNNEDVRKAVEAELTDFDIGACIASGEFTQSVPVTTGLTVLFRSVTPEETRRLRILLFEMVSKDPGLEYVSDEIYSQMLICASVVRINDNTLPEHRVGAAYTFTFDSAIFTRKFETLSRYPDPMVHALGVHGAWFDNRVRKSFRHASLKNG